MSKISGRQILCCPGPVQLHRSVKHALAQTQLCHRDNAFEELQERTAANIRTIARTDEQNHKILFITGSGTSANETAIVALGKLGRILVISNGEFGERLQNLADLHHEQADRLVFRWGQAIDLKQVEATLKKTRYTSVVIVHHETSTGMLNPINEVTRLAHTHGAVIYVDAVSSLGAEEFKAAEWGIDAFTTSSGKALAAVPGIGIVGITPKLAKRIANVPKTVQYLDLSTYITYADKYRQTPNTPSVHALAALEAATARICRLGLGQYQATICKRAQQIRAALQKMELSYFDYGLTTSSVITCVRRNERLNITELLQYMRQRGIVLYGGKGELEGNIFQIGHIGELSSLTMWYVLRTLKAYLDTHNYTNDAHERSIETPLVPQEMHHAA
ncbi:MAG TPA: aminotransferase class V-fold PLP-dependent enzyme [Verrucomicrobiae bacterium]|nr:aminotransferase class V-fold PLP-dependent enzyme [Verrucomicrobiae bacterium]